MAAKRLFDIFNAKIGATQVQGAESLNVSSGFRKNQANNDGFAGVAAVDKTYFYASADLECQDLTTLMTLLALFEANDSQSIIAEGKVAGDISASQRCTFNRAKLAAASLNFMQGDYAKTRFSFRNSASSASTKASDEVTWTDVPTKTITHSTALRAVKINGATFTPSDGSPATIVPLAVYGLDFNIQFQVDQHAGDAEFGETVEVAGFTLDGTLSFRDSVIATADTVAQKLLVENYGSLEIPFAKQAGGSAGTLTLANVTFTDETTTLAARKFGGQAMKFSCFTMVGANAFTLATGSNKIITVA